MSVLAIVLGTNGRDGVVIDGILRFGFGVVAFYGRSLQDWRGLSANEFGKAAVASSP
jgi:hypothetical protein